jgi:hypothetical protein
MKSKIVISALAVSFLGWLAFRYFPHTVSTEPAPLPEVVEAVAPTGPTHGHPVPTDTALSFVAQRERTNLFAQLANGESLPVTLEQLAHYLQANHRNAESLLAAYQATHEKSLLEEAMTNYPNDPRVAYSAWFRSSADRDDAEALKVRREKLDLLKEAAPDNALVNYLSAGNYFASGQRDLALQELQAGAAKPNFNDYTQDSIQSMTEAYMAAGYSEAEAKLSATTGTLLPHLAELKQDGLQLVELAKSYQQAGDIASARAMLQMCQDLGSRLDDANSMTLIQPLVGIALQRMGLEAAASMATDTGTSQALQNQINALARQREDIKSLVSAFPIEQWLQTAAPEEIIAYCDRQRVFGEQKTLQWLADRNPGP